MTAEHFIDNILGMIDSRFENLVSRPRMSDKPESGIPYIRHMTTPQELALFREADTLYAAGKFELAEELLEKLLAGSADPRVLSYLAATKRGSWQRNRDRYFILDNHCCIM